MAEMAWIENRPTHGWRALDVREVWRFRHLVRSFARRDVTVRYRQAALGVAWAILQPLAGALMFTVVFTHVAHVDSGEIPYLLFAYIGWAGWTYFAGAMGLASSSLVRNADLVTKVYFPRITAPLAAVLPGLIDLAVGLLVAIPLLVHYDTGPGLAVLALPLGVLLLVLAALGAGLALGSLHVRYRDVGHATALLTQLWLFASPVAYPSTLIHGGWRYVYALNPVAGGLDVLRWSTAGGAAPGPAVFVSAGAALVLLAVGVLVFQRGERRFADVI
jgi:ABC-type polysaccharide/polyol phosphate export permease